MEKDKENLPKNSIGHAIAIILSKSLSVKKL
jgi:hypothetical protein